MMNVPCEAFDNGAVFVHNLGLGTLKGRNELWDVVDFGLVENTRADFLRDGIMSDDVS